MGEYGLNQAAASVVRPEQKVVAVRRCVVCCLWVARPAIELMNGPYPLMPTCSITNTICGIATRSQVSRNRAKFRRLLGFAEALTMRSNITSRPDPPQSIPTHFTLALQPFPFIRTHAHPLLHPRPLLHPKTCRSTIPKYIPAQMPQRSSTAAQLRGYCLANDLMFNFSDSKATLIKIVSEHEAALAAGTLIITPPSPPRHNIIDVGTRRGQLNADDVDDNPSEDDGVSDNAKNASVGRVLFHNLDSTKCELGLDGLAKMHLGDGSDKGEVVRKLDMIQRSRSRQLHILSKKKKSLNAKTTTAAIASTTARHTEGEKLLSSYNLKSEDDERKYTTQAHDAMVARDKDMVKYVLAELKGTASEHRVREYFQENYTHAM